MDSFFFFSFFGHLSDSFCVFARGAIKLDSSFCFRFFFLHEIGTHSGKKCAIKIILRNRRCEKPHRGLIHFLYLFSSIFPLLGLILLYLFFIFSRNWFATHQRTFLLDFVAHYKSHIHTYPPRALHNDDANKNTTPLR